jgi:uncharacterized protein (DUF1330 family)
MDIPPLDLEKFGEYAPDAVRKNTIGTPEELIERLKGYEALGIDEYSIWVDSSLSFETRRPASNASFPTSCPPLPKRRRSPRLWQRGLLDCAGDDYRSRAIRSLYGARACGVRPIWRTSAGARGLPILEGNRPDRVAVIEFDTMERAVACFQSPEYAAARAEREGAAIVDIVLMEAVTA